jgi:predicted N-acetyltransferase YhbS
VDPPPITVRDALPAEYDEIGRLTVEAYEQYEALIPPELWERYKADLRDVAARAERATILVAEEAGTIVGAIALTRGDDHDSWPAAWAGARVLAVPVQHRRKGVARALMDACADLARAWGASAIALHTAGFMSAAVGLYETLGLRRLPEYEILGASGALIMAYGIELVPGGLASIRSRGAQGDDLDGEHAGGSLHLDDVPNLLTDDGAADR